MSRRRGFRRRTRATTPAPKKPTSSSALMSRFRHCAYVPTPQVLKYSADDGLSESCPKTATHRCPRSPILAAPVPSVGTVTLQVEFGSRAGAMNARHPPMFPGRTAASTEDFRGNMHPKPYSFRNNDQLYQIRQTFGQNRRRTSMKFRPLQTASSSTQPRRGKDRGGIIMAETAQVNRSARSPPLDPGAATRAASSSRSTSRSATASCSADGRAPRSKSMVSSTSIMKESDIMGVLVEAEAKKKAA